MIRTATCLLLCLILGVLTGFAGEGDAKTSALPSEFSAFIGGFDGKSYKVELSGEQGVLHLEGPHMFAVKGKDNPQAKKTVIPVDPAKWKAFRKALDEAKVWEWKKEYINPEIMDGTVWELKVKYADASATVSGSNAYPDKKQFAAFRAAVVALTGGKEFK